MATENDTPAETREAVARAKAAGVETWEQKRDRERAENAKARKATAAKLAQVFKLLGFTPKPDKCADRTGPEVYMSGTADAPELSGLELNASANTYRERGRVSWHVDYPGPKVGQKPYDRDWPKPRASASLEKSVKALAADVARRILPDALRGLEMARKANKESDAYANAQQSNLAALLGRELTEDERREGRSRFDGCGELALSYGSCRASSEDVELELHGVPVALAVRIMDLLRVKPGA